MTIAQTAWRNQSVEFAPEFVPFGDGVLLGENLCNTGIELKDISTITVLAPMA